MTEVSEALEIIEKNSVYNKTEIIPIELCTNRIIAEDIFVKYSIPSFPTSAVDGYGVGEEFENICNIKDTILAGHIKDDLEFNTNETIKIMTGSKVPNSIKNIIPIEKVQVLENNQVKFIDINYDSIGNNIRPIGEDLKKDTLIISKNQLLNASFLAILAANGITHVKVFKKLSVAILSSGDELKLHFEKINSGEVYNTNSIYLLARLQELNCNVTILDKVEDKLETIKAQIEQNLNYDLIISTGGASVGEADFIKKSFEDLGIEYFFNTINIKPGKPISFGKINNCYILLLGGYPFAMAATFELFGKSIINRLQNKESLNITTIKTKARLEIKSKKPTIIAGFYDGEYFDYIHNQKSSRLNVLNNCNSYIVLEENTNIAKDEIIEINLYC
jgi:molybdopterin molybdotransferase